MTLRPEFTPKSFIYLAGPYSHPDPAVREARARVFASTTCVLQLSGFSVHSPISQGHATHEYLPEKYQHDHDFWMQQDLPILRSSSAMLCLLLPGWQESKGLQEEVQTARDSGVVFRFSSLTREAQESDSTALVQHFQLPNNPPLHWTWPDLQSLHQLQGMKAPEL